jgi:hypothetical protein
MINRIIFVYLWVIGLPLLLLPIAVINTMVGHSIMYISIIFSPIGLIVALCYSDIKRQYEVKAIVIRSMASLIIFFILIGLIVLLSEAGISTFLKNYGWILIPLTAPLITATVTNEILESRIQKKSDRNT